MSVHHCIGCATFLPFVSGEGQLHVNPAGFCTMSSIDHSVALLKSRIFSGQSLNFVRAPPRSFPGSYSSLYRVHTPLNTPLRRYTLATGPLLERKLASNAEFPKNVSLCRCSPSSILERAWPPRQVEQG